jgi:aspartate/methionine/tyrosine aminotransferase
MGRKNPDLDLLAVKVDGPTKEGLAWGLRVGFITFAAPGLTRRHYDALENKVAGGIRSLASNSSRLSQSLLIRAMKSGSYAAEKREAFEVLRARYRTVTRMVLGGAAPPGVRPLPFNSGYFMTIEIENGSAEELRARLLAEKGIGTIAVGERHQRIAYSSVNTEELEDVFAEIFRAAALHACIRSR